VKFNLAATVLPIGWLLGSGYFVDLK